MLRTALILGVAAAAGTLRHDLEKHPLAYAERLKPNECFVKLVFEPPPANIAIIEEGVPILQEKLYGDFAPFNARLEKISLTGIRAKERDLINGFVYTLDMTLAFTSSEDAQAALEFAEAWIANPPPAGRSNLKVKDKLHDYLIAVSSVPYEHYYVLHTVVSTALVRAQQVRYNRRTPPLYVNGVETPYMALSNPSLLPSESPVVGNNCTHEELDIIALNALAVLTSDAVNACLKPKPELRECVDCNNALLEIADLTTPSCYVRGPLDPFLYGATYAERIDLSYALDKQYYEAECVHRRRLTESEGGLAQTCHDAELACERGEITEAKRDCICSGECSGASALVPSLLAFLIACVLSK